MPLEAIIIVSLLLKVYATLLALRYILPANRRAGLCLGLALLLAASLDAYRFLQYTLMARPLDGGQELLALLVGIFATAAMQLFGSAAAASRRRSGLGRDIGQLASDLSPVGIFVADARGSCTQVSSRWSELTGIDAQDALADGWRSGLHPADRDWVVTRWAEACRDGHPFKAQFRFQHPDGRIVWVHGESKPELDEQGGVRSHVGSLTDITDFKIAEQALRQSEERLRRFAMEMPVMLVALDEQRNLLVWNRECERITGFRAEEMVGNPRALEKIYPDADLLARIKQEADARAGDYRDWELPMTCKDGAQRVIAWSNISDRVRLQGWPRWAIGIDATERRRTGEDLQQALRRLNYHVDNSPLGVLEWDSEFRLTRWSPRCEEIFGWTAGEVLGRTPFEWKLIYEPDRPRVEQFIADFLAGNHQRNISINQNYTRDGRLISCCWYNSVLVEDGGKFVSFLSHVMDVTESRLAEQTLRRSRSLLAGGLDQLAAAVAIVDHDGMILEANRAFQALAETLRLALPGGVVGAKYADFIAAALPSADSPDAAAIVKALADVLEGRRDATYLEQAQATPNPQKITAINIAGLALDGERLAVVVHDDITPLRSIQQALRLEEQQKQSIFEHMPVGILLHRDGRVIYANPICRQMFGAEQAEDLIGRETLSLVHPDMRPTVLRRQRELVAQGKTAPPMAQQLMRFDGALLEAETSSISINFEGRPTGLVMLRDMGGERRADAALMQASRMEATATLAGGVAHDFNNLLMGVLGNAEMLRMRLEPEPDVNQMISQIIEAAQKAGGLAHQLLAFARGGKYQPRVLNLNDIIHEVLRLQESSFPQRIQLESDLDPALRDIEADPVQLGQVLMNLCLNSVEAIEHAGRVIITTRNMEFNAEFCARHPGLTRGPGICLAVQDNGSGMDEATLSRIFEPFFTTKFTGRGLGLAAVYGIVKNHGGYIGFESRPGRGTLVQVFFNATAAARLGEPTPEVIKHGQGTVLVIDDEPIVLEVTERMLRSLNYHVLLASNGRKALELAGDPMNRIDLALLDLGMPGLPGAEVFPLLHSIRPDMKILICSGYELDETTQGLIDAGAVGFLQKPYRLETLAPRLREALELTPPPRPSLYAEDWPAKQRSLWS